MIHKSTARILTRSLFDVHFDYLPWWYALAFLLLETALCVATLMYLGQREYKALVAYDPRFLMQAATSQESR